ncbi:coiled-coil domain-containing protein 121-like [Mastomys coucha]|uniref:coiled-coil domain-containing protein 121-like n=1 Tax=Mastomys coucha TaxID=35658 RepID=UPI001261E8A8|nr:coiled-coil domain-containing protein 121-like [Mastomys coucha]
MLAQSPRGAPPPTPHLTILNTYLQPKLLTRLEKRVKRKTVVAMKELSQQIQETKCRREGLLKDSRQLLEEKYRVQAENRLFMEYLRKNKEQSKDQEAHFQFLREKALMEKELQEWQLLELGQINTAGLTRKYKALALAAKQAHSEFCGSLHRENQQLRTELQQLGQEYGRLDAVRSQLEKRQQLVKEQQWYLEALTRGRQRLQAQRERHHRGQHPCLKEQRASKTMLSTKSRTSSK